MSRIGFYYKWKREQAKAKTDAEDAQYEAYQKAIRGIDQTKPFTAWQKKVADAKKVGEQLAKVIASKAKAKTQAEAVEAKKAEDAWHRERMAEYQVMAKKPKVIILPKDGKVIPPKVVVGKVEKYDFMPSAEIVAGVPVNLTKEERFHEKMITMEFKEIKRPRATKLIFSQSGRIINNAQISFAFTDQKVIIPEPVEIPEVPEVQLPVVVIPNYPVVQATA